MSAFDWIIQLVYVAAASCFVLGLHLMNTPATARRGNQLSTGGMVAAVAATLAIIIHAGTISATGWIVMLAGALVGGGAGLYAARTVQMTAMPQLVSIFNAVGGGAAALVAIHDYINLAGAAGGRARDHHRAHPAGRDHRRGDLLRVDHRRRQAAGPDQRGADHLPRLTAGQRRARPWSGSAGPST